MQHSEAASNKEHKRFGTRKMYGVVAVADGMALGLAAWKAVFVNFQSR